MNRFGLLISLVTLASCAAGPEPARVVAPPTAPPAASPVPASPGVSAVDAVDDVHPVTPADIPDDTGPTDEETIEIDAAAAGSEPVAEATGPHPLEGLTDAELEKLLVTDPAALGSISVGTSSAGRLFNGVQMPESDQYFVKDPDGTWGTQETVDSLVRAIAKVNEQHADSPALYIGHISSPTGGYLKPHGSHQAGRDADIGYYYSTPRKSASELASEENLDLARSWALIRALITETDVQWIFSDSSVMKLIEEYAVSIGEDPEWVDGIFGGGKSKERPIVIHVDGHATHLHVRFYSPIAQTSGIRLYPLLISHKKIHEVVEYTSYKVKRGDTLGKIAKKHNTTVKAIKKLNGLTSSRIYAGRTYKIPKKKAGGVKKMEDVVVPPRRLPPG